jgi:hypothetical protein
MRHSLTRTPSSQEELDDASDDDDDGDSDYDTTRKTTAKARQAEPTRKPKVWTMPAL